MDEWVGEWEKKKEKSMNGWMERRDGWVNRRKERFVGEWIEGGIDRCVGGDGKINGREDKWKKV